MLSHSIRFGGGDDVSGAFCCENARYLCYVYGICYNDLMALMFTLPVDLGRLSCIVCWISFRINSKCV